LHRKLGGGLKRKLMLIGLIREPERRDPWTFADGVGVSSSRVQFRRIGQLLVNARVIRLGRGCVKKMQSRAFRRCR